MHKAFKDVILLPYNVYRLDQPPEISPFPPRKAAINRANQNGKKLLHLVNYRKEIPTINIKQTWYKCNYSI
jgi:hypothetical protein